MSFISIFPTVYADAAPAVVTTTATTSTATQTASPWSTVIMLVVFFAIFYFLLIRPQSKRAKQQRQLLASLAKGDEVMTAGGLMGKITEIEDTIVSIEIVSSVIIRVQKSSISSTLPKGTLNKVYHFKVKWLN